MIAAAGLTDNRAQKSEAPSRLGRKSHSRALANSVFDAIERIQTMNDRALIADAAAKGLAAYGIEYFAFARPARNAAAFTRGIVAERMHAEWTQFFFDRGYAENNPLISDAAASAEPTFWSDASAGPGAEKRLRQMLGEAVAFGLREGMCVPILCPGRYAAVANFSGFQIDKTPQTRLAVQAMAIFTCRRLVDLAGTQAARRLSLTARKLGAATCIKAVVGALHQGAIRV